MSNWSVPRVQRTQDQLGQEEPRQGPGSPHQAPPHHLGDSVVLEVDPAVGHHHPHPHTAHHGQALPGDGVGQSEQGEEDRVAAAEPHELAVTARHSKLLKLDRPEDRLERTVEILNVTLLAVLAPRCIS